MTYRLINAIIFSKRAIYGDHEHDTKTDPRITLSSAHPYLQLTDNSAKQSILQEMIALCDRARGK
ncbi:MULTISPECIES: hypothetical protein [Mesorhizobium]|uniref:Uncharacterized protein n=1 Tax=Rhizobium loti TaxID=381 RepID=A0AA91FDN3_RHILI|nr:MULTISPECIES: hypothetical protein [Mesorhizobium]KRB31889.1 hypothetical protein ASE05_02340 [Mesorhizobium sp. Root172]OBQ72071.1 hypothetical protein A8145_04295 [Mesorhizobium loti]QKC91212.1 hypothetical protein EB230_24530 [Mesorhizobium sp. NZP2234]